jgi:FMN phosphatase YigB (HAD superfamily)
MYHLAQYGLGASQTAYVDDTEVILKWAARFGIQTIQFNNPGRCACQLQALACI